MDSVYATREAILGIQDQKIEEIFIPEWNMKVRIKSMTGKERDDFEASILEQRGNHRVTNLSNVRAKIAALTVVDENGKRLFTEQDTKTLSQKNASALQQIMIVAQKLSGIGEDDVEELTEELEENPFDNSATDSA